MRYSEIHKQESRARVLRGVGRGFRKFGFGGIGVDGLAHEAGATSGAFYSHFGSKTDAFRAAVVAGLQELREGIVTLQATSGAHWLRDFTEYYLGYKRTCDLAESCALQSMSAEVSRADDATRVAYEGELTQIAERVMVGLADTPARSDKAWAMLALVTGGTTLARAVHDPALAETIAAAVKQAVAALTAEDTATPT